MTIVVQSGTLRGLPSARLVGVSSSTSAASRTVSVTPAADEVLILAACLSGFTSAGFLSLTANGVNCNLVLDQTYVTTAGYAGFYSIPTSTTGFGTFNVTYTCANSFKNVGLCVWALKRLTSLTAKTATYKAEPSGQGSPYTPATGITVAANDLVFSALMITPAATLTYVASNTVEAPTETAGVSLSQKFTHQTIASAHAPFQMRYDWTATTAKAGAFACVSYA